jgi:hypothetical protein
VKTTSDKFVVVELVAAVFVEFVATAVVAAEEQFGLYVVELLESVADQIQKPLHQLRQYSFERIHLDNWEVGRL